MEFLEVLETIQSGNAATVNLFNSREDGTAIKSASFRRSPQYKKKLVEAAKVVAGVIEGKISPHIFMEVMTTSDFPLLFGDILDRSVLAAYNTWEVTWDKVAKRATVADFRSAKIYPPTWGADGILDDVPEASEYPDAAIYEQTPITWNVTKYGRKVPFSWESLINDDLDQLKDIPEKLGHAARRTENNLVSRLYVGASGPNTTMYNNTNHNIVNQTNGAVANNPALSISGLEDAYLVLSKMTGENGEPIHRDMVTLVVPPALEIRALNILNATEIRSTRSQAGGQPGADTDGYQELAFANWMRNKLTLVVDPYIPTISSTANGNSSWFMFQNPSNGREAIRIGFLRGHETPEIWMKSPNAVRVGGGSVGPNEGDFDTDSITYRVRHITGVVQIDPKATVMSNGSGS